MSGGDAVNAVTVIGERDVNFNHVAASGCSNVKDVINARIALSMLQPLQRERLMKNVCCGLSSRVIAKQEGVYYSSVDKSIAAAKKNFIEFYENL